MYTNSYLSLKEQITLLTGILRNVIETSPDSYILPIADQIHSLSRKALVSSQQADEFFSFIAQYSDAEITKASRFLQFNVLINNLVEMYFTGKNEEHDTQQTVLGMLRAIDRLKELNYTAKQAKQVIEKITVNLIMTVHPSQITRRSYLNQQNQIIDAIGILQRTFDQEIIQATQNRLKDLLTLLWFSDEIKDEIPEPLDEANWAISVAENNLWNAVPQIIHQINDNFIQVFGEELNLDYSPIKLSTWIGGSYFLNRKLDSYQSKNIFCLSYKRGIALILNDLRKLRNELTLNYATDKIKEKYNLSHDIYRTLLIRLIYKLENTDKYYRLLATVQDIKGFNQPELDDLKSQIVNLRSEILEPLQDMLESLTELKLSSLSHGLLQDLIIRIKCFGLGIFEYDVVHHAQDYYLAVTEIFKDRGEPIHNLAEEEIEQRLIALLTDQEALDNFIPKKIIDNAQSLFRKCATTDDEDNQGMMISKYRLANIINSILLIKDFPDLIRNIVLGRASNIIEIISAKIFITALYRDNKINIITNFERKSVLEQVPNILERLYQIPGYLESCGNQQYIMLSYSGTIKDCGNITSNWLNYKVQESFKQISEKYNVDYYITHGRGGAIGRGGNTTHAAILSLPEGALRNGFRIIEQGEMIRFKFGTPELSKTTLDYYLSSTLLSNIERQHPVRKNWREMMEELSELSYQEYRSIVHNNKEFEQYYLQATPHQEFSEIMLGHCLPSFNNEHFPYSIRDISWLFAWMQNRLILPNWLGSGTAVNALLNSERRHEFVAMYSSWKFFKTRIDFLEMIYYKVDLGISELYERQLLSAEIHKFAQKIHKCVEDEGNVIRQITGGKNKVLLSSLPWIAQSIKVRSINSIPLHLIQIEVIKRVRKLKEKNQEINFDLRKALRITTTTIAAGLRNTG